MSVVHVLKWVMAELYEYGMSVCVIDVMNSVGKANLKLTQQATSYGCTIKILYYECSSQHYKLLVK